MASTQRMFRCICGKLHTSYPIGPTTRCPKCDRRLWPMLFRGARRG